MDFWKPINSVVYMTDYSKAIEHDFWNRRVVIDRFYGKNKYTTLLEIDVNKVRFLDHSLLNPPNNSYYNLLYDSLDCKDNNLVVEEFDKINKINLNYWMIDGHLQSDLIQESTLNSVQKVKTITLNVRHKLDFYKISENLKFTKI